MNEKILLLLINIILFTGCKGQEVYEKSIFLGEYIDKNEIKVFINDSLPISFLEPSIKFTYQDTIDKIQKIVLDIENYKRYTVLKKYLKIQDSLNETEENHQEALVYYKNDSIYKIQIKHSYISYSLKDGIKDNASFLYIERTKKFYFIHQKVIFNNDTTIKRDMINGKIDNENIGGWNSADFYWYKNTLFDYVSIGISELENDEYDPESVYLNDIKALTRDD